MTRNGRFAGVAVLLVLLACAGAARAALIDFEDGTDRMPIRSTIPGLEFTTTDGYDWVYGDWRSDSYNGPYPNGPDPSQAQYWSYGNFFAWLGENQGRGVITFTWAYATYVSLGYSADTFVYLEAYDQNDNMLANDNGGPNLDTGSMNFLRVDAPGMAYVIVHDTGNQWLIDNLETDAITQCVNDSDCDDGVWCTGTKACQQFHCVHTSDPPCPDPGIYCDGQVTCNEQNHSCDHVNIPQCGGTFCAGLETCDNVSQSCLPGTPVTCADDGIYCNGAESCSDAAQACVHSGSPCPKDEACDEANQACVPAVKPGIKGLGGCGCGA